MSAKKETVIELVNKESNKAIQEDKEGKEGVEANKKGQGRECNSREGRASFGCIIYVYSREKEVDGSGKENT
eukprot:13777212-Ditylum_brightwellii.AAC.1